MTADAISARIDAAPALRPVTEPAPVKIKPSAYVWTDPAAIPKREFLYGYELQRKHVSAIVAPGAAGKTTYKVSRALALVTGRPLLGRAIHGGPYRVWLWNHEDNLEEQTRSIQATCKLWDISQVDLGDRLFLDSAMDGAIMKLVQPNPLGGILIDKQMSAALAEALIEFRVDYLDLDPFVSIHGVDENDNMAIDSVVKELGRIATSANCAIGLAHHVAKARSAEVDANSARGAVALTAGCRSVLAINRMSKDEAEGWKIHGEDRRRYFRLYDDKNNRAPPADDPDWYKIESVQLPNGDNVGVVTAWNPPDIFDGVTTAHLAEVQRAVAGESAKDGGVREDIRAARWIGRLICPVLGMNKDNPSDKRRAKRIFEQWLVNGAFETFESKDKSGNPRTFVRVGRLAEAESIKTGAGFDD